MFDHLRGPGFFTTVAGSSVLGAQFVVLEGDYRMAIALWIVSIVLWVGLTYAIFAAFTIKEDKPTLDKGISGAWLLAVVATQSIAVLSALVAPHLEQPHRLQINFLALSMWLWGGMLYIWMMSLIFYRYMFFRLAPGDLSPPYWINMGAMAISTLAGSLLIMNAPDAPFLLSLLPVSQGLYGLILGDGHLVDTHAHRSRRCGATSTSDSRMKYDPMYWGAVFPLGMYAAGTHYMNGAMGLDFLGFLPQAFLYIALAAWSAAFIGLGFDLYTWLRPVRSQQ